MSAPPPPARVERWIFRDSGDSTDMVVDANQWMAETAGLTKLEAGLYQVLLMACWRYGGTVAFSGEYPSCIRGIKGASRAKWRRSWPAIADRFVIAGGVLTHPEVVLALSGGLLT